MGIHHAYLEFGYVQSGDGAVHGGAQGDHPVFVGQGNLYQRHVAGKGAGAVHRLGLEEVGGKVIGIPGIHVGAHVGSHEEPLLEEDACVLRSAVGGRTFRVEMVEVKVPHLTGIGPFLQGADEDMGDAGHTAQMDVRAASDPGDRQVRGDGIYHLTENSLGFTTRENQPQRAWLLPPSCFRRAMVSVPNIWV